MAYGLLYFVVLFYACAPTFRRRAEPYISRRFGNKKFSHFYKLYLTFGKILVDRATLGITGNIKILSSASDQKLFKDLHARGRGLVVITAHAGAWQSAMSTFDFMEGEKYVLYRRVKEDVDKQAHEHGKTKQTVKFIDPASGAVEMVAALEKNAIICVMGDREFGSPKAALKAAFLGGEINVPGAPYRVAAAMGAPVVIIYFPFSGAGRFNSVIAAHFVPEERGAKLENYQEYAALFTRSLEDFCSKYPYQYFNFFDIWRNNDDNP